MSNLFEVLEIFILSNISENKNLPNPNDLPSSWNENIKNEVLVLGEKVILEWKKQVGDMIERDETLLEISTDKVDSEVPSPAKGKVIEILFSIHF